MSEPEPIVLPPDSERCLFVDVHPLYKFEMRCRGRLGHPGGHIALLPDQPYTQLPEPESR